MGKKVIVAFLFALLGVAGIAQAAPQVPGVWAISIDAKGQKKFKKNIVAYKGDMVLMVEIRSGAKILDNGAIQYNPGGTIEVFIHDPREPETSPWFEKDGERVASSRKNEASISGAYVEEMQRAFPGETLNGISLEYRLRLKQLEKLEEARDEAKRGSADWSLRHERYLGAGTRFVAWLKMSPFPDMIGSWEKIFAKAAKRGREEFLAARGQAAQDSIKEAPADEVLIEVLDELGYPAEKVICYESTHLRITSVRGVLSPEEVEDGLRYGEMVIEQFRKELVDPYVAEDFKDVFQDRISAEWIFVPDSGKVYRGVSEQYLQSNWDRDVERRLEIGGERIDGHHNKLFRFLRRWREGDHLHGQIVHQVGHMLAGLHFGNEEGRMDQDWLSEAVAWWLSFEMMGVNQVTCIAFHYETGGTRSDKTKDKEGGEKTLGVGRRGKLNEVALTRGQPIERLALKTLFQMGDADVAKGWSFFDYLVREEGKNAQLWLRMAGKLSLERSTMIAAWREGATKLLEVPPGRSLKVLEERWRDWAVDMQDTSEDSRRRR
jgi:hypothetical protein